MAAPTRFENMEFPALPIVADHRTPTPREDERKASPTRWWFSFDGWADASFEEEFVLA